MSMKPFTKSLDTKNGGGRYFSPSRPPPVIL